MSSYCTICHEYDEHNLVEHFSLYEQQIRDLSEAVSRLEDWKLRVKGTTRVFYDEAGDVDVDKIHKDLLACKDTLVADPEVVKDPAKALSDDTHRTVTLRIPKDMTVGQAIFSAWKCSNSPVGINTWLDIAYDTDLQAEIDKIGGSE